MATKPKLKLRKVKDSAVDVKQDTNTGSKDTGMPTKPKQVGYVDLLDALAAVDPTQLISRRLFTPYNPEVLVTRKGLQIFDAMKRDEQVKAALKFKKDAVLSPGWEVASPGEQDSEWEVTRFVKDQLNAVQGGWRKALYKIMHGLEFGYSVTEKVYKEIDAGDWSGKVGLDRLISIKPHYIDFLSDEHGTVTGILQRNSISEAVRNQDPIFPPGKFVHYSYAQEFENPYGYSDLVAAHRAWWTKDNAYKWLAIYLERYGMPPLIAMYNYNTYSGNQLDQLKKLVKNIQNSTFGILPRLSKEDIELFHDEIGTSSKEIFVTSIEKFDRDISRALLVPGLMGMTSDEATGSLARSNTHFDSFMLIISDLQQDIAENAVNGQVIKQLCDLNFPGLNEYPLFRFLPMKDEKRLEVMNTWSQLVTTKIVGRIEDDEAHIRASLGFPENSEPKLEPLPTDAQLEVDKVAAKNKPAPFGGGKPGAKPKPKTRKLEQDELTEQMIEFAEDNFGVWIEHEGRKMCVEEDELEWEE